MSSPGLYRDYVRGCIAAAERSKDPEFQRTMLQMAKHWLDIAVAKERKMAVHAERSSVDERSA